MNTSTFLRRALVLAAATLYVSSFETHAITLFLQEQGPLTGFLNGGTGSVLINQTAMDHWIVTIQDSRIGTPINPSFSLAFVEPETVSGFTAYNNVQVLSVAPGMATFDVLSDEFSPYSTTVQNGNTAMIQNTSIEPIFMNFTDFADSVPEPSSAVLLVGGSLLIWLKRARGLTFLPGTH